MIKKILRILESDARTTPKQISTMTGAPQSEVVKLIKQAEKDQTILKYKTIINWEKVKEEQVSALIEVKVAPLVGWELDDAKAGHSAGGRIGAVGRVGDEHLGALDLAPALVVGTHHQHPGELAVGAGCWLQADAGKTGDFFECLLQFVHQFQAALDRRLRLEGMHLAEAFN